MFFFEWKLLYLPAIQSIIILHKLSFAGRAYFPQNARKHRSLFQGGKYDMALFFAITVTLIPIVIALIFAWPLIQQMAKLQKAREGKRTQFIIDTSDRGYPYYQEKVEQWLADTGFSKYKRRKKGRYLIYYIKQNRFKFGLNYYQQESKLILDAWLCVCGKESPLTFVSFSRGEGRIPLALDQYGKDEYSKTLNTLITIPEVIKETNPVTLQYRIDVSTFKDDQKAEKRSTQKLIWGIIIAAFAISALIHLF